MAVGAGVGAALTATGVAAACVAVRAAVAAAVGMAVVHCRGGGAVASGDGMAVGCRGGGGRDHGCGAVAIAGAAGERPDPDPDGHNQQGCCRRRNPCLPAKGGGCATQEGEARLLLLSEASLESGPEIVRCTQVAGLLAEVLPEAALHLRVGCVVMRHCPPPPSRRIAPAAHACGGALGAAGT